MQRPGSNDIGCTRAGEDLAELALGTLSGEERARVVAHVSICEKCSRELEGLCAAVDGLTELVRAASPPEGFAEQTVAAFGAGQGGEGARRPRAGWRRPAVIAAAAAVVVLGVGFGADRLVGGQQPSSRASSESYSNGTSAALWSPAGSDHGHPGTQIGEVVVTAGAHAWVMLTMDVPSGTGTVTCRVLLSDGRRLLVGRFPTSGGSTSWGARLPVPASSVRTLTVSDPTGKALAWASFS